MSSANQKTTHVLSISCTFATVSPILKLPSVVSVADFFSGAFKLAHPLKVLLIFRTIFLRGRAGGNRNSSVEQHLMMFRFFASRQSSPAYSRSSRLSSNHPAWSTTPLSSFAHPLIVLVIYRTILLRGRAGSDENSGVERHLILFITIGIIMVLSSAIREFTCLSPLDPVFNLKHSQIARCLGPHLLRRAPSHHRCRISGIWDPKNPETNVMSRLPPPPPPPPSVSPPTILAALRWYALRHIPRF